MSNITLPIVIFDRQHLIFCLSKGHALNYLKQSSDDHVCVCDGKGQLLAIKTAQETSLPFQDLVLMDNIFIGKGMLLEKFKQFLQLFEVSKSLLDDLSVHQLIWFVYRLL